MPFVKRLSLWLLFVAVLDSTALAADPIEQFVSPFGGLNLQNNGMFPTPENPNPPASNPPSVPPMTWDNWDGRDTSMDATCGDDYYDFRTCASGPTFSITLTVPWYRYAACTAVWRQYLDYYLCLSASPAYYTRSDDWGSPGKPNCAVLPSPLRTVSADAEYWGGSPSAWECLPMTGDSTCFVPCRESGIGGSCYSFQGSFCSLTIYASRFDFCTRKKIGTISRRKHYLFSCDSVCGAATSTNSLDDILQQLDPTLDLCREGDAIRFITSKPELYGGLREGYVRFAGSWLMFLPQRETPVPVLPSKSPLALSPLAVQAARFSPKSLEEMKALLAHHAFAQVMAEGLTRLSADLVYGLALPEDIVEDCFSLRFSYTGPNPQPCGSTTNRNGGTGNSDFIFTGSLVTCSPTDKPRLMLAWDTDPAQVGGLRLSSPNYEINDLLPTGPLPAKGTLLLTNVLVRGDLTVMLYGTNLATGQGVLKILTLQPDNSGYVTITNGSASAVANASNSVTVNFAFDAVGAGTSSARLPYSIRQSDRHVESAVVAPATGVILPFTTDEAGLVVLTVDIPCGNGTSLGYRYTTNYYVPGAAAPAIELFSFYPDAINHRVLTNDVSPSTVKFRILNPTPESQTISFRLVDLETGSALNTGSFTAAFLDLTNNVRETELQAWATSTNALRSASARRRAHILVETPMLVLPPVLNNSYAVAITNQTQARRAFYSQLFNVGLAQSVDGLTNLYYPENGTIQFELDGNNVTGQTGYWTNILANSTVPNRWFQQGSMNDPVVLPAGFAVVGTRFAVADLQVTHAATNGLTTLAVSTITTNAQLALEQRRDGINWQTVQTVSERSAVFTNINLGYETRLTGTKDRYNPAYFSLPRVLFLSVDNDPCTGLLNVTVNAAVTNVTLASAAFATNFSFLSLHSTDSNGFSRLSPFEVPDGKYVVTATGHGAALTSTNIVSGSFSYSLRLVASPGASFVVGTSPTNGQPVYVLQVSGATNPRIELVSDKPSLQFHPAQPARVDWRSPNEIEINVQGIAQTTEFAAPLVIADSDNPQCPNLLVQLGVIVRRGGGIGFDIPVSDPKTGDCLRSRNGQISIWTGP